VQETKESEKSDGFMLRLRNLILWPLKRLLAYSLEHPLLLQRGTRLLSHFPPLFNWMVGFAQAHGIVMAAEDTYPDPKEIHSVSELSPEGQILFESLKSAFQNRTERQD
jgi:hypothetical protein